MTSYDWAAERAKAIAAFSDQPHAQTEQDVLEVFQHSPVLVIEQIESVGKEVQRGSVRSGWAVLRARLLSVERANVIVSDAPSRDKRLANAERWMRSAGLHIESEDELVDELFGERGKLRAWSELKPQMLALWAEQRVIGVQIDQAVDVRVQERRAALERIAAKRAEKAAALAAGQDWVGEEPPLPEALSA